jgi:hypothetical protein
MQWRFSFRAFMISITLMMITFAAMVSPWPIVADVAALGCQFLLCVAIICAFVMPQKARPFWIGFAVIGFWYWSSLSASDVHSVSASRTVLLGSRQVFSYTSFWQPDWNSTRSPLPTTTALDWLQTTMHNRLAIGTAVSAQYANGGYYPGVVDDINNGLYLIRWTDGSSSPAQWTPPSQIAQVSGNYNFRLAGHTLFCGLFGLLGGMLAMWIGSWNKAEGEEAV